MRSELIRKSLLTVSRYLHPKSSVCAPGADCLLTVLKKPRAIGAFRGGANEDRYTSCGWARIFGWCGGVRHGLHNHDRRRAPTIDRRLTALNRFVGTWRGAAEGEPGTGTVERTYTPILAGKFIEERNIQLLIG